MKHPLFAVTHLLCIVDDQMCVVSVGVKACMVMQETLNSG